jgi:type I restriction enzyme, S subunit
LPALTARADQIKQLRQTILNLAVRGKIVPQDPNDEPAIALLNRVMAEKEQLVSEKEDSAKGSSEAHPSRMAAAHFEADETAKSSKTEIWLPFQ